MKYLSKTRPEQAAQLEQVSQVAQLEAKVKNGFSQVAELIEALTKTPNAEPIAQPKQTFGSNVTTKDMKYDRIEKYRNALLNK